MTMQLLRMPSIVEEHRRIPNYNIFIINVLGHVLLDGGHFNMTCSIGFNFLKLENVDVKIQRQISMWREIINLEHASGMQFFKIANI